MMNRREEAGLTGKKRRGRRKRYGRGEHDSKSEREGPRKKGRVSGKCELKMTHR